MYPPVHILDWTISVKTIMYRTVQIKDVDMAVGRPREFDMDAVLDRAMDVFWRRGYEGACMTELTASMAISRPSLYAAFGDKRSLFHAVVNRYLNGHGSSAWAALAKPGAREAIRSLLTERAMSLTDPDRPSGCLAIQAALVCGEEHEEIKNSLVELRHRFEAAIRDRLLRAEREGDFPAQLNPAVFAQYISAVTHGMAVQAVGGASRQDLLAVADLAFSVWP